MDSRLRLLRRLARPYYSAAEEHPMVFMNQALQDAERKTEWLMHRSLTPNEKIGILYNLCASRVPYGQDRLGRVYKRISMPTIRRILGQVTPLGIDG